MEKRRKEREVVVVTKSEQHGPVLLLISVRVRSAVYNDNNLNHRKYSRRSDSSRTAAILLTIARDHEP